MPVDLYCSTTSPPCRAVLLTAKAVGVQLNLKTINVLKGEHMAPSYLKLNPQHTIPFMVDGSLKLGESRAICSYLATQYGKDDSLYPNNPRARSTVDQRLYFDIGTLYQHWADFAYPVLRKESQPDHGKLDKIQADLAYLNNCLLDFPWVAGNKPTIADHCLAATVATLECAGVSIKDHSRVKAWLRRCEKQMPGYAEANAAGANSFGSIVKPLLGLDSAEEDPASSSSDEEDKKEEVKKEVVKKQAPVVANEVIIEEKVKEVVQEAVKEEIQEEIKEAVEEIKEAVEELLEEKVEEVLEKVEEALEKAKEDSSSSSDSE